SRFCACSLARKSWSRPETFAFHDASAASRSSGRIDRSCSAMKARASASTTTALGSLAMDVLVEKAARISEIQATRADEEAMIDYPHQLPEASMSPNCDTRSPATQIQSAGGLPDLGPGRCAVGTGKS